MNTNQEIPNENIKYSRVLVIGATGSIGRPVMKEKELHGHSQAYGIRLGSYTDKKKISCL